MSTGELFIGNLPHAATEQDIRDHFSTIGNVHSINLVTDRKGRSRCFGFITIENPEEAVEILNQKMFQDRPLRVSRAFQKNDFQPRHMFHNRRGR